MVTDLPDYHSYIVPVTVNIPQGAEPVFIPRPKGGVLKKGSVTTTSAYVTVASHVVTNLLTFHLAKIKVSASKAAWIKFLWSGTVFSMETLLDDKTVMIEHFPWNYYAMAGDGAKLFEVQTKYESEAGTVNVEIVGEEV